MATIGLDRLYYAKITEDASGEETYASPVQLAKAMTAEMRSHRTRSKQRSAGIRRRCLQKASKRRSNGILNTKTG